MVHSNFRNSLKRVQRGFTILQMTLVVAISAVMAVSVTTAFKYENKKLIGQTIASNYQPYFVALQSYVVANQSALLNAQAVTGVALPYAPTVTEMKSQLYLPQYYSSSIPSNGGTPTFKVGLVPSGCLPASCGIEYLMYNAAPELDAAGKANENLLDTVAKNFGANAGFSTNVSPTSLVGAGGWTYPNPAGSKAGILGIYVAGAQAAASTPSLNTSTLVPRNTPTDKRDPSLMGNLTVAGNLQPNTVTVAGIITTNQITINNTATFPNFLIRNPKSESAIGGGSGAIFPQITIDSSGRVLTNLYRDDGSNTAYYGYHPQEINPLGGYTFQISGHSTLYYGVGLFTPTSASQTTTGTFKGDIICMTASYCGKDGWRVDLSGSGQVWKYTSGEDPSSYPTANMSYSGLVTNESITNVIKKW